MIQSTPLQPLTIGPFCKSIKSMLVDVVAEFAGCETLRESVAALRPSQLPVIERMGSGVEARALIYAFHCGDEEHFNVALEISLSAAPGKSPSCLLWSPFPTCFQQSSLDVGRPGIFHELNIHGKVLQPRRTLCFGKAYHYSGRTHAVEADMPSCIEALLKLTNSIFGLDPTSGVNMDLVNMYACGRMSIATHSDDDGQMGLLRDVYCWVTGNAARSIILRRAGVSEVVLRVALPAGLYAMMGSDFQKDYSHEIPQLHPTLFKALAAHFCTETRRFAAYPREEHSLIQAEWMVANRETICEELSSGAIPLKRGANQNNRLRDFAEWAQGRVSHTLRRFE